MEITTAKKKKRRKKPTIGPGGRASEEKDTFPPCLVDKTPFYGVPATTEAAMRISCRLVARSAKFPKSALFKVSCQIRQNLTTTLSAETGQVFNSDTKILECRQHLMSQHFLSCPSPSYAHVPSSEARLSRLQGRPRSVGHVILTRTGPSCGVHPFPGLL